MDKMPKYLIVESTAEIRYFRKTVRMLNGQEEAALLRGVLEHLSEAMWDWPRREELSRRYIFETVRYNDMLKKNPATALGLNKSIWGLYKAIDRAVEIHKLTIIGIFPYRFHEMLGDNIVMAFYPD